MTLSFDVMKKAILKAFYLALTFSVALAGEPNLRDLMTPPADTIDAQRIRIWMPIEHSQTCLVKVTVVDSLGNHVRTVIEKTFSPSYYNFFWDKKDDSGRYVPEGTYTSVISDLCAPERRSDMAVVYAPGELSGLVVQPGARISDSLFFEISKDSVVVSLEMLNRRDILEIVPFTDSLFDKGTYVFSWQTGFPRTPGPYTARITIDGYLRTCPIRYIRRQ